MPYDDNRTLQRIATLKAQVQLRVVAEVAQFANCIFEVSKPVDTRLRHYVVHLSVQAKPHNWPRLLGNFDLREQLFLPAAEGVLAEAAMRFLPAKYSATDQVTGVCK